VCPALISSQFAQGKIVSITYSEMIVYIKLENSRSRILFIQIALQVFIPYSDTCTIGSAKPE